MSGVMDRAGRGGRANMRSAPRLTRTTRGAMKVASEAPTSRSHAHAPERALVTDAGEGPVQARRVVGDVVGSGGEVVEPPLAHVGDVPGACLSPTCLNSSLPKRSRLTTIVV